MCFTVGNFQVSLFPAELAATPAVTARIGGSADWMKEINS
jgi:hypothetical protein